MIPYSENGSHKFCFCSYIHILEVLPPCSSHILNRRYVRRVSWPIHDFHSSVRQVISDNFRTVARCEIMLQQTIYIWIVLLKLVNNSVIDNFNVYVGIHHSLIYMESCRTLVIKTSPEHNFLGMFSSLDDWSILDWRVLRLSNNCTTLSLNHKVTFISKEDLHPLFYSPI